MKTWMVKALAGVATAAVFAGIGFVFFPFGGLEATEGSPRAWIDDPMDGSTVALGAVEIVAHAYDPAGVTDMVLMVDGVETEVADPTGPGGVLAHAVWSWVATEEGIYVLEVYGKSPSGSAGLAGRAVVTVGSVTGPVVGVPTSTTPGTTVTTLPGSTSPSTTAFGTTTTIPGTTSTTRSVPTTTAATTTTTKVTTTTASPTTTTSSPTTTTTPPPCSPPKPILVSPSHESEFVGPNPAITLDWEGWRGTPPECLPSGYFVHIATDLSFSSVVGSAHFDAATTEWATPRDTWVCNTIHYWRVWSKRSDGSLSMRSDTWQIWVGCG